MVQGNSMLVQSQEMGQQNLKRHQPIFRGRAGHVGLTVAVVAFTLTSCSSKPRVSSSAPPMVICGQTLWSGAAGASVFNYFAPGTYRVADTLYAGQRHPIILRFSPNCRRGVSGLTIDGQGRLEIAAIAHATDNSIVAIAVWGLQPGIAVVTVSTTNGGTIRAIVTVAGTSG